MAQVPTEEVSQSPIPIENSEAKVEQPLKSRVSSPLKKGSMGGYNQMDYESVVINLRTQEDSIAVKGKKDFPKNQVGVWGLLWSPERGSTWSRERVCGQPEAPSVANHSCIGELLGGTAPVIIVTDGSRPRPIASSSLEDRETRPAATRTHQIIAKGQEAVPRESPENPIPSIAATRQTNQVVTRNFQQLCIRWNH